MISLAERIGKSEIIEFVLRIMNFSPEPDKTVDPFQTKTLFR